MIIFNNNLNLWFEIVDPAFGSPLEQILQPHKIESWSLTLRDATFPLFVVWDSPQGAYYVISGLCSSFLLAAV